MKSPFSNFSGVGDRALVQVPCCDIQKQDVKHSGGSEERFITEQKRHISKCLHYSYFFITSAVTKQYPALAIMLTIEQLLLQKDINLTCVCFYIEYMV